MRFESMRALIGRLAALVLASALGVFVAAGARAQQAPEAPDGLVKTMMSAVLDAIKKDPSLQAGDPGKLNALVDEKILPYVNFEKMTRLAVGPGWRQASPEQRQALVKGFRVLLVRTYSGAVSTVTDHQIQMKPFRAGANDTDVIVRTAIAPSKGEAIQIDYRLEKAGADWKIYDVSVLGVWLVENYKGQFASEVAQGGIDGLVKSIEARNQKPIETKK
jgi:phospholipid transport system substrate-binding protein